MDEPVRVAVDPAEWFDLPANIATAEELAVADGWFPGMHDRVRHELRSNHERFGFRLTRALGVQERLDVVPGAARSTSNLRRQQFQAVRSRS